MYPICLRPLLFALPYPGKTIVTWKESCLLSGIQNQSIFNIYIGGGNSAYTKKVPTILVFAAQFSLKLVTARKW